MKLRLFLLAGAFALALAAPSAAQPLENQTIPLNGATALELEVRTGDLLAVPDPLLKVVQIHVEHSGTNTSASNLLVAHTGHALVLTIKGPGAAVLPFAGGSGHVYEVHYPPALPLRIRQFGGAVTVTRPAAPVEILNESGGINVSDPAAAVTAEAARGDVRVSGARASVELTADAGNVDAQLAAGWSGRLVRLEASRGNLTLAVPQDFRARFDATAPAGTVTNPLRSEAHAPLVFMLTQTGNVTVNVEKPKA